ncbi:MAG TPA: hypothetical protein PLA41_01805 [Candidatus Pacearchaeota archaeon]|nr:hypothetical protein [Candidatus Pacearchaeota archaeon]HQI74346.1 hypothetical protein [Candidatus Pacearchaeota archaeon]
MKKIINNMDVIEIITQQSIQDALYWVKATFIFFTLLFMIGCAYLYATTGYLEDRFFRDFREFWTFKPKVDLERIRRWKKINDRMKSGIDNEYKIALLEAMSMLEDFMFENLKGETFEEQLMEIRKNYPEFCEKIEEGKNLKEQVMKDKTTLVKFEQIRDILNNVELFLRKAKYLPA